MNYILIIGNVIIFFLGMLTLVSSAVYLILNKLGFVDVSFGINIGDQTIEIEPHGKGRVVFYLCLALVFVVTLSSLLLLGVLGCYPLYL